MLTGLLYFNFNVFVCSQTGEVYLHRRFLIHWNFLTGGELEGAFFYCFGNLLNDIWRMVRFDMYVIDYVIWFLVGSIGAIVEIKSGIQIIYYFHITLSIITSRPLFLNTLCFHLRTTAVLKNWQSIIPI